MVDKQNVSYSYISYLHFGNSTAVFHTHTRTFQCKGIFKSWICLNTFENITLDENPAHGNVEGYYHYSETGLKLVIPS